MFFVSKKVCMGVILWKLSCKIVLDMPSPNQPIKAKDV